ncbi:MAG: carboxynorspermidine decarboxylase [Pseudobutyrivibrio sp.]|nr:carboxynorspermidine decarboxylase [Pseudobutyrivibrio sp.]
MNTPQFRGLDNNKLNKLYGLNTPCYVIDEARLIANLEVLKRVEDESGCKILLAQKAFSNYDMYPVISEYLAGTEASGLYEARLGATRMPGKEVHVFCGAYKNNEFEELLQYADHIVFNSPAQLKKFGPEAKKTGKSIGLRINPEFSTQEDHEIYDPCSEKSRLGTTYYEWQKDMDEESIAMLDGLHFHTLCEQNSDDLAKTLDAFLVDFGQYLPKMKWLNMGGGHHITRDDYDIDLLKQCIARVKEQYDIEVYLEPGEAIALNAGYLITSVLDVVNKKNINIGILDMSAACHTPDVIEMPYRPPLMNSADEGEKKYTYLLGGPSCLSGDVIGSYSFDEPLIEGSMLVFGDMAIYSMCKNNTFNGMPLPSIYLLDKDGEISLIKSFGYNDFEYRLGS